MTNLYVRLPDRRIVELIVNPDTGLIVVDIIDADDKGGIEILRAYADTVGGRRFVLESLCSGS